MKAILHCDENWGIGAKNDLMFSIPADMKFFRETTSGKVVVMGSNTLLSFPASKPLKNRLNIVLWPEADKRADCVIVNSLPELFDEIKKHDDDEVYVIGGAMMYKTMLPYCSEVLVTKVQAEGEPDVYFENLDNHPDFELVYRSEDVETNGFIINFCTYKNNNIKQY